MAHVCFLREKLVVMQPPVWGKQTFQKSSTEAGPGRNLAPAIEPGRQFQGQLVLSRLASKDLEEELRAPATHLAFDRDTFFAGILLQQ